MLTKFIFGVFNVLHGLVLLWDFGQRAGFFELCLGMVWPDGSWVFSKVLGNDASRTLAVIALILAAIGFAVSGIGTLMGQAWWRPLILGTAVFSTASSSLFWNGKIQSLDDQGMVGILINIAILAVVLILRWPPGE